MWVVCLICCNLIEMRTDYGGPVLGSVRVLYDYIGLCLIYYIKIVVPPYYFVNLWQIIYNGCFLKIVRINPLCTLGIGQPEGTRWTWIEIQMIRSLMCVWLIVVKMTLQLRILRHSHFLWGLVEKHNNSLDSHNTISDYGDINIFWKFWIGIQEIVGSYFDLRLMPSAHYAACYVQIVFWRILEKGWPSRNK